MSRLVVVSNRVTRANIDTSGSGGLAVGLTAALQETDGLWFGWSGAVTDQPTDTPNRFTAGGITYATVDLSPQDYDEYYNGFANANLWPLFHYRLDLCNFQREHYEGYRRVNRRFARVLSEELHGDDLIWVHDYHLIPLAEELRKLGVSNRIGFFLHTPFPSHQVMIALPQHREIVQALTAYDVVGFQTATDLRTFSHYIKFETRGVFTDSGVIRAYRNTFLGAKFPIGIDTENVRAMAGAASNQARVERLRQSLRGRDLIIGVDRLDYSKGLTQRFQAFEYLMEYHPEHRGQVVLLQIAPPSREEVAEYSEIREELQNEAGRINGRFAEFDWVPIRYLNRGFPRDALSAFFRHARVGLVTPMRDGMNLVAKEYFAAQSGSSPGVLVLSRFAGAAEQLTSALVVNPYDREMVAANLARALDMSLNERKGRWRTAMKTLRRHDISAWRRSYLRALQRAPYSL